VSISRDYLLQTATRWPYSGPDAFGDGDYDAPELIDVRWEDRRELIRDADGRQFASSAVVYAGQPLAMQDYLAPGDETASSDPRSVAGAREIRQVGRVPSLDASDEVLKHWLG